MIKIKNKNKGLVLRNSKGFTLIETLIYIALFTILVGTAFATAYQLIQGTDILNTKTVNQEEVNFVLRKINWALGDVSTINNPLSGSSGYLSVTRYDSSVVEMRLNAGQIELKDSLDQAIFEFDLTCI